MRSIRLVFAACLLSAAPLAAQATATICKDATTSVAAGRGACSGHGGVDGKATAKAAKAATAAMKAEAAAKKQAAKTEKEGERASDKGYWASTTVSCTDGSKSGGGRGACSGHGGIAVSNPAQKQAEKAETKAAKAEAKTEKVETKAGSGRGEDNNPVGAIAKCKDGMYSHSANRRGACSRHGGVASWT